LIEVLVSALMVILIGTATAKALISTAHLSGDQRLRSQADALATQDQERLRGLSDEQLNGLTQTRTVTLVTGTTFTVKSVASFADTTGGSSCTSGAAAYYKIASTVSWTEAFTNQSPTLTEESLLSRPVTGAMVTQVNDETGQPVPGVTVTARGLSTQTGQTDSNGCASFAGLLQGSYNVVLAATGYVDPNGLPSPPNMVAAVSSSTGTAAAPSGGNPAFVMGKAGSIAGTFTTYAAGTYGEADAISWYGTLGSLSMSAYQTSTPSTASGPAPAGSLTTGSLFPFYTATPAPSYANNYTAWAGRCLQQEPPAGIDQYTLPEGSPNQAQNVQEPLLDVGAVTYAGSTVKPAHVKLTFSGTSGTSCTYSWYPTLSTAALGAMPTTGWLAKPGQPFATTATTGSTKSASGQTGTLTVCADYNPGSGYRKASSAALTNTSFTAMNVVPSIAITSSSTSGTC
jgi:hypothetical protein